MKRLFNILMLLSVVAVMSACGGGYDYETVKGDPMKARIYTLDNGLKVYMAENHEEPRIQTYIAVRAGGKNSPLETTGLAHYFEHLMFKGTQQFGTTDYEAEEPMLDEIERLFEVYRKTTDEAERKAIYAVIDSISYEASKLSIPNEYDKLMSAIGANGTNAYTGDDMTVYVENIPANQVENWAKIQADRFRNVVLRGFHTELETIYEEYNMYSVYDSEKIFQALTKSLFKNHPYGLQTVIGDPEHLKNPSITNIKEFHKQYYVPNNMAICLSGDFDPDEMIAIVDKYFGSMEPNNELKPLQYEPEAPITEPVVKDVVGLEAEMVYVGWRLDGMSSSDADMATLAEGVLSNGMAGLMDVNLNQQQKVFAAQAGANMMADYGMFLAVGMPKEGQTLEEVQALLMEQVDKLRKGDFDESLLKATLNNIKAAAQQRKDSNAGRADMFVTAFINGLEWKDMVEELDRMSMITKEDLVAFANEKLADNNYVVVYKRQGIDENMHKIAAPEITPIEANRNNVSAFLQEIQNTEVSPIEPVFVDYEKDMAIFDANGVEVLYKQNMTNEIFDLSYIFETGTSGDPLLSMTSDYVDYLGTSTMSAEQMKQRLYDIACSVSFSPAAYRTTISISGLSENMAEAMKIFEEWIADVQGDETVLANLKNDLLKNRANAKLDQASNYSALNRYVSYGPEYIKASVVPNEKLTSVTSEQLLERFQNFADYEHRVVYYGPMSQKELTAALAENHKVAADFKEAPAVVFNKVIETPESKVFLAEYDANQIRYMQLSNRGEKFDTANDAELALFNEYFGGGMNAIVFQEMREARGLAYSASAYLRAPSQKDDSYNFMATIATQNDKMAVAIDAFDDIINNMPESEAAFTVAKNALLARLRTERTIKDDVLWSYLRNEYLGVDYDRNKAVFEAVQDMTLEDVKAAQQKWTKDRTYHYGILGRIKDLDMNKLKSMGEVTTLSQEEIFGY